MKTLLQTSFIAATLTLSLTGCFPNTNVPAPGGTGTTNQVVTQGAYTVTKPEYLWVGGAECINLIDAEPTIENMTAGALAGIQTFCDQNREGQDYAYYDVPGDTGGVIVPERDGGLPWKIIFVSAPAADLLAGETVETIMANVGIAANQVDAECVYYVLPPSVPGDSSLALLVSNVRSWMMDGVDAELCINYIDPDDYGITIGSATSMLLTDSGHQDLAAAIEYTVNLHP